VGGTGVLVGGTGVLVGGTGVLVGGSGVLVGGGELVGVGSGPSVSVGAGEVLVPVAGTGVSLGSVVGGVLVTGVVGSGVVVADAVTSGVWLPPGVRVTTVGLGVTMPVAEPVAVGADVHVGTGVGGYGFLRSHNLCPGLMLVFCRQLTRMISSTPVPLLIARFQSVSPPRTV
jgi:hypothetical protein